MRAPGFLNVIVTRCSIRTPRLQHDLMELIRSAVESAFQCFTCMVGDYEFRRKICLDLRTPEVIVLFNVLLKEFIYESFHNIQTKRSLPNRAML